jgi:Xaa-Pro aminopeptidase
MSEDAGGPVLRVVRGEPTAEELAALTVVLTARAAAAAAPKPGAPRSEWRDRASLLRRPLHPGPGAWRASARPH